MVTGAATALMIAVALPLWRPLLVAGVLAGALSPLYESAVRGLGGRRSFSAALFTAATVILILIPVALLAIIAVREVTELIGLIPWSESCSAPTSRSITTSKPVSATKPNEPVSVGPPGELCVTG